MNDHTILVYSNYSSSCKKFAEIVRFNAEILNQLTMKELCIDNKEIRNRIKMAKKIDIREVPCILNIYKDGGIEKFEGQHAFRWLETIIDKIKPPQSLQQPLQQSLHQPLSQQQFQHQVQPQRHLPPQSPQMQQFQPSPQYSDINSILEMDNMDNSDSSDDTPQYPPQYPPQHPPQHPPENINIPVPRIRKDSGNYENIVIDTPKPQRPEARPGTSKKKAEKSNLRAKADEMMKMRSEIEKIQPPRK